MNFAVGFQQLPKGYFFTLDTTLNLIQCQCCIRLLIAPFITRTVFKVNTQERKRRGKRLLDILVVTVYHDSSFSQKILVQEWSEIIYGQKRSSGLLHETISSFVNYLKV
jgi:hypothetical protein